MDLITKTMRSKKIDVYECSCGNVLHQAIFRRIAAATARCPQCSLPLALMTAVKAKRTRTVSWLGWWIFRIPIKSEEDILEWSRK